MSFGERKDDGMTRRGCRTFPLPLLLCLMVTGLVGGYALRSSQYIEFKTAGTVSVAVALACGVVSLLAFPACWSSRSRCIARLLLGAALGVLILAQLPPLGHPRPHDHLCAENLRVIERAMYAYSQNNDGFRPYADEGSLESLAVLYPAYLRHSSVFLCPVVTERWGRRNEGLVFPPQTSLAGARCHYTYEWQMPRGAGGDCAVLWDRPGNHREIGSMGVLHADGQVRLVGESMARAADGDARRLLRGGPQWRADEVARVLYESEEGGVASFDGMHRRVYLVSAVIVLPFASLLAWGAIALWRMRGRLCRSAAVLLGVAALFVLVIGAASAPAVAKVREEPVVADARSRCLRVADMLQEFTSRHEGALPGQSEWLRMLRTCAAPGQIMCLPPPFGANGDSASGATDITLLPLIADIGSSGTHVIAWQSKACVAGGAEGTARVAGRFVILADGGVRFVDELTFRRLVAESMGDGVESP